MQDFILKLNENTPDERVMTFGEYIRLNEESDIDSVEHILSIGHFAIGESCYIGEDFIRRIKPQPSPQNLHTFKVTYLPHTAKFPSRVKIRSERFEDAEIISSHDERFENINTTYEKAIIHLESLGFNIVGFGTGDGCMYVMSDTFKPLKQ